MGSVLLLSQYVSPAFQPGQVRRDPVRVVRPDLASQVCSGDFTPTLFIHPHGEGHEDQSSGTPDIWPESEHGFE